MLVRRITLFMSLILVFHFGFAQQKVKVIDVHTGLPLAFVNVRFDDKKAGCSTDINGKFITPEKHSIKKLHLTYVGYRDTTVLVKDLFIGRQPYIIKMQATEYALSEVVVLPGINPAHRIIQNVIDNRKHNNPEKLSSFSYKAYHKMVFTADSQKVILADTSRMNSLDSNGVDSSDIRMQEYLSKQHLFMMESVSERKYLKPDRSIEKIFGTRVSGMQAPMFAMLATQFQSFSFYKPIVQIAGLDYVNPISSGSTKKYFFKMEDTLYDQADTVFIIAFRPLWGKNFEGLKGVLYIHSADWAIKSVIAEPFEWNANFTVRIEQLYEPVDSVWFPIQLNTRLTFPTISLNRSPLVGIGHTYLDEIQINPKIKAREFNHVTMEMDPNAAYQDELFWNTYREDSLDAREKQTYVKMDSIGKEINADRWYKAMQILSTGQIPVGKLSFDLDKFYQVNMYEKSRFGIGMRTNERLLPWMVCRGYGAYALGDKKWKYGGGIDLLISKYYDVGFSFDYTYDLQESAQQTVFGKQSYLSSDFARNVLIQKMVDIEQYASNLHFRALKHFRFELGANHTQYWNTDDYLYRIAGQNVSVWGSDFKSTELSLGVRFGFREKFIARSLGLVSLGTKYPILHIQFTQGMHGIMSSVFDFQRLDAQLDYSFKTKYLGNTKIRVAAGMISESLPWYMLYNGRGSYAKFFVDAPFSFNTMRMNEFLSDEYAAVYLRHNFGNLLYKTEHFEPELSIVSSATIGKLNSPANHKQIEYKTLEKGYLESGFIIDNLFRSNITALGLGVYYRYGPYTLDKTIDNFVFRLSTSISI